MKHVSRRTFLKITPAGVLAAYTPGAVIADSNHRIRVAVIGLGGKSPAHISSFGITTLRIQTQEYDFSDLVISLCGHDHSCRVGNFWAGGI